MTKNKMDTKKNNEHNPYFLMYDFLSKTTDAKTPITAARYAGKEGRLELKTSIFDQLFGTLENACLIALFFIAILAVISFAIWHSHPNIGVLINLLSTIVAVILAFMAGRQIKK